jgi:hypothetical protein
MNDLGIRCEEMSTTFYAGPCLPREWELIDKDGNNCGSTTSQDLVRALRGLPKDASL